MDEKLKKAAAISAVFAYLRSEEEALSLEQAGAVVTAQGPAVPLKLWGISGRQAQMQLRGIMQLKGFHR